MVTAFGERMTPPASMEKVLADGRKGRKNKHGFYTYDDGHKRVDESVYALLPDGGRRREVDAREVQDRLAFAFLNEACGASRGHPALAQDGDVGAIFGLGFSALPGRALSLPGPSRARALPWRCWRNSGCFMARDSRRRDARRPGQGGPPLSCRTLT